MSEHIETEETEPEFVLTTTHVLYTFAALFTLRTAVSIVAARRLTRAAQARSAAQSEEIKRRTEEIMEKYKDHDLLYSDPERWFRIHQN